MDEPAKVRKKGLIQEPSKVSSVSLAQPVTMENLLNRSVKHDWVVYAKRPFGGPQQVLKYLARYTHRVAISNSRLLEVADGRVTFGYKDYSDKHRSKTMTLAADEFLRRFVQHVLPKGFVKVRHYGLLANRCREERLAECRSLLLVETIRVAFSEGATEGAAVEPAVPIRRCPHCGRRRIVCRELPPSNGNASPLSVARVVCDMS